MPPTVVRNCPFTTRERDALSEKGPMPAELPSATEASLDREDADLWQVVSWGPGEIVAALKPSVTEFLIDPKTGAVLQRRWSLSFSCPLRIGRPRSKSFRNCTDFTAEYRLLGCAKERDSKPAKPAIFVRGTSQKAPGGAAGDLFKAILK